MPLKTDADLAAVDCKQERLVILPITALQSFGKANDEESVVDEESEDEVSEKESKKSARSETPED